MSGAEGGEPVEAWPGGPVSVCGYLEESDVVARRVVKTDAFGQSRSTVRLGLVSEVFEDSEDEEDEEDAQSSNSGRLQAGQALVEWYPSGKESRVEEERVVVMDRTLMLGEMVTRSAADGKTIGIVLSVAVTADLAILPPPPKDGTQYVLAKRNLKDMDFVNPFDASSNSNYVFYKDWVGALTEVKERLLLSADKGYKCWLNSSETEDVRDRNCKNRKSGSSFDISQWYEGQELVVAYENLRHAEWLPAFRPPDRIRRSISKSHGRFNMTIEKVKLVGLNLEWMCYTLGDRETTSAEPPPTSLEGDELKAVTRLDWFEYQTAQMGDRMLGVIGEGDVVQKREEWEEGLARIVQALDDLHVKSLAPDSASTPPPPDPPLEAKAESGHSSGEEEVTAESEDEDAGPAAPTQDSAPDSPETYYTASEAGTPEGPAETERTAAKPRPKPLKPPAKQKKDKRKRRPLHKPLQPAAAPLGPPSPGQDFIGEVLLQKSLVTVLWMDGRIEADIPAAHLRYNQEDLDEHVFFAGAFVELLSTPEGDAVKGYGFCNQVNADERIATVTWYDVTGVNDPHPKLRLKEQVAEMELRPFTHFSLAPGTGVIRAQPIPASEGAHPVRNVGQVTGYELESGKILVKWFTGEEEAVWPTTIIRAFDSYDPVDDQYWSEGGEDGYSSEWTDVSSDGDEDIDAYSEPQPSIPQELTPEREAELGALAVELVTTLEMGQRTLLDLRSRDCVKHRMQLCRSVLAWQRALHRLARMSGRYDPDSHPEAMTVRNHTRAVRIWTMAVYRKNDEQPPSKPVRGKRSSAEFVAALMRESEVQGRDSELEGVEGGNETEKSAAANAFVRSCVTAICGPDVMSQASNEHQLLEILMTQSAEATTASFSDPQSKASLASIDIMLFSLLQISSIMAEDIRAVLRQGAGESNPFAAFVANFMAEPQLVTAEQLQQALMLAVPMDTDTASPATDQSTETDNKGMEVSPETEKTAESVSELSMETEEGGNAPTPPDGFGKGRLEVLSTAPGAHKYAGEAFVPESLSRHWHTALRNELKLLRTSLPPGLIVKTFEDRMNLFSCLMTGPVDTPFFDSLFFFDIKLPEQYPNEPPLVYYRSYSGEQLNPNLYQNGKVCVSLLGTWSGKGSEKWNPGSNLLQVLVSIQGLILNAEPYYNEAGYESRKGAGAEYAEKSRRYNEMCILRSVDQLVRMSKSPPEGFEAEVSEHVRIRGPVLASRLKDWMSSESGSGPEAGFPLHPLSAGWKLASKRYFTDLNSILPSSP